MMTRPDRKEPDLNEACAGDIRGTTTSKVVGDDLQRLVIGLALPCINGQVSWMLAPRTGGEHLCSGLAPDWIKPAQERAALQMMPMFTGYRPDNRFLFVFSNRAEDCSCKASAFIAGIGQKAKEF